MTIQICPCCAIKQRAQRTEHLTGGAPVGVVQEVRKRLHRRGAAGHHDAPSPRPLPEIRLHRRDRLLHIRVQERSLTRVVYLRDRIHIVPRAPPRLPARRRHGDTDAVRRRGDHVEGQAVGAQRHRKRLFVAQAHVVAEQRRKDVYVQVEEERAHERWPQPACAGEGVRRVGCTWCR